MRSTLAKQYLFLPELEVSVAPVLLIEVSVDLEDPPQLHVFCGEVAVGVAVLHVAEEVVQVLYLVDGVDEDHYLGVLDEAQVGDHEGDSLFLSHQHVLLLQVLGDVDLLAVVVLRHLFFCLGLEADVLGVVHRYVLYQPFDLFVEVGRNENLLQVGIL